MPAVIAPIVPTVRAAPKAAAVKREVMWQYLPSTDDARAPGPALRAGDGPGHLHHRPATPADEPSARWALSRRASAARDPASLFDRRRKRLQSHPPMSVVVGYVPDATGLLALQEARQQAQWRATELVVVNVVGAAGYAVPTAADERNLDAVSERLTEQGVRFSIRQAEQSSDRPSEVILEAAADTDAELIVVGVRRTSPVVKAVLGSTVQRVLADATCPVLCVRAEEQE